MTGPNIIIDDGGDLVNLIHTKLMHLIPDIIGGCEETTTGVMRLNAMMMEGALKFPMITVNNARCKYLFDNRYGTGQSVWDGINRTTNLIVAGKNVVIALRLVRKGHRHARQRLRRAHHRHETDPVKALEAAMDGFDVMPMSEAAKIGDLFITATGCRDIITRSTCVMKDGAVLCNAGHFNVEVDVNYLDAHAVKREEYKPNIKGILDNGRTLFVRQRQARQSGVRRRASGRDYGYEFRHPALSVKYLAENREKSPPASSPCRRRSIRLSLGENLPPWACRSTA